MTAPTYILLGHNWDLYSLCVGVIIILLMVILFSLFHKKKKILFVNLRKEIADGNEGISESVKILKDKTIQALENINDVLDEIEKNG